MQSGQPRYFRGCQSGFEHPYCRPQCRGFWLILLRYRLQNPPACRANVRSWRLNRVEFLRIEGWNRSVHLKRQAIRPAAKMKYRVRFRLQQAVRQASKTAAGSRGICPLMRLQDMHEKARVVQIGRRFLGEASHSNPLAKRAMRPEAIIAQTRHSPCPSQASYASVHHKRPFGWMSDPDFPISELITFLEILCSDQ